MHHPCPPVFVHWKPLTRTLLPSLSLCGLAAVCSSTTTTSRSSTTTRCCSACLGPSARCRRCSGTALSACRSRGPSRSPQTGSARMSSDVVLAWAGGMVRARDLDTEQYRNKARGTWLVGGEKGPTLPDKQNFTSSEHEGDLGTERRGCAGLIMDNDPIVGSRSCPRTLVIESPWLSLAERRALFRLSLSRARPQRPELFWRQCRKGSHESHKPRIQAPDRAFMQSRSRAAQSPTDEGAHSQRFLVCGVHRPNHGSICGYVEENELGSQRWCSGGAGECLSSS